MPDWIAGINATSCDLVSEEFCVAKLRGEACAFGSVEVDSAEDEFCE
jgi:hypothetical protein